MSTSSSLASPDTACSTRSGWTPSKDTLGLPHAGRTGEIGDEGYKVWKQRDLWSYGTYALYFEHRTDAV